MNPHRLCLSFWIVLATLSPVHLSAQTGGAGLPSYDVDADGVIGPADVLALVDYLRQVPLADRDPLFDSTTRESWTTTTWPRLWSGYA